jgi:serine/threonine protein kinase
MDPTLALPPPEELPERIGPYRPTRKLGQGGMGIVYCAEDLRQEGRLVALKVIAWRRESAHDDAALRFQREAKILERLRHPNIVTLYEVGAEGAQTYLAMELLDGTPLSAFYGLPWPQTVPLLAEICSGMAYLASQSIVHRDLSPDNVLVVEGDGRLSPKILDFGIAKDTTRDETLHDFTRTGTLMGKPQYWSPEQVGLLSPGESIDWRSDLYSSGIIFFRVLSGELPFQAASPIEYVTLHAATPPPPLAGPAGGIEVPAEIRALVDRMLAKKRTERPHSWEEVEAILRGALAAAPADLLARAGKLVLPPRGPLKSVRNGSRQRSSRAAPSMQRMPSGAMARKEKDVLVRTGPPTAPTVLEEPPTVALSHVPLFASAPRTRKIALAAAALLGIWVVGWVLVRFLPPRTGNDAAKGPTQASQIPGPSAPAGPAGTLALHSVPWARIVSIVEQSSGRKLELPGETTPMLVTLPEGRYAIEVASGVGSESETIAVEIRAGVTESRSIVFVPSEKTVSHLE